MALKQDGMHFVLCPKQFKALLYWRKIEGSPVLWNCKIYGTQHMICMKNLRFSSRPRAKVRHQRPPGSARQGVTCIKGFFGRGWGGRNWHHFENREAMGRGETLGMIKIGHEQKVTNVMAQQDLWVFTCWAEFCRFLECKEIATGHNNNNKKTGSHLFLVFRKVISLFRSFVISPFCHFAISCFKHALVMQWFPLPRATDSLL